MPATDLELLITAARCAAPIAMSYFRQAPQTWEKADGAGPVTVADLEVDAFLREMLGAARPDYGWMSEETEEDVTRLNCETVFVVDPIDGTRAFVEGTSAFAHSLAVVTHGQVTAAVVCLPAQDKLYAAAADKGATLNDRPIRASADGDPMRVLMNRATMDPSHWPGGVPGVERVYRPSIAYRLCLVAEGRFEGLVTFRQAWEWDIAAGSLIAAEAGACVTDRKGGAPHFNTAGRLVDGCIAAPPVLHADLLARHLHPA